MFGAIEMETAYLNCKEFQGKHSVLLLLCPKQFIKGKDFFGVRYAGSRT